MAGTTYSYQSSIYLERKIRSLTNQISRKQILWTSISWAESQGLSHAVECWETLVKPTWNLRNNPV